MAIFVGVGQSPNIFILNLYLISLAVNFSLLEMLFVVIFVTIYSVELGGPHLCPIFYFVAEQNKIQDYALLDIKVNMQLTNTQMYFPIL